TPKWKVLGAKYRVGAAKACLHTDAGEVAVASGCLSVVEADAVLVWQHDKTIADHLARVFHCERAPGFTSKAGIGSQQLLACCAGKPIGVQAQPELVGG